MIRLQIYISNELDKKLEEEALRRIRNNDAGRRVGAVKRDIIVAALALTFREIQSLSKAELEDLTKKI